MRWLSILLTLIALAVGLARADAKPSVAIAPIEGDDNDKVGNAIAEILGDDAETKGPTPTGKAMSKLGLSGELTIKDKKQLFKKLAVDALVEGKLEKDGKKKKLALEVTPNGKKSSKFTVEFKSAASDSFRDDVRAGIVKRLGAADDGGDDKDKDNDKDIAESKKDRDKDKKAKDDDDDQDKAKDKDKDKDKDDDDDDDKKDRDKDKDDRVAESDDDGGSVRKKKKKRGDDDDGDDGDDGDDDDDNRVKRHRVTQVALRVNLGAGFGVRTLTYAGSGMNIPPRVGTPGASARLEAELYPFAFEKPSGAGGIGIYGDYDKTLGLSIAVPGTNGKAAIDQAHFSVGARYRIPIGMHSLAFGAAYAKRKYVVDRSGAGAMLDVPDVNYSAIAPGAVFRIGAAPKIGIYLGADALLMLDAGPIASKEQYGKANIVAFEVDAGIDIALGKSYALRFGAELTQIAITFEGTGAMADRMVKQAQDRQIGGAATFAVTY